MTRKIILRPSLSDKRQPLLPSSPLDRRQSPFHSSSFDQRRTPLLAEQQSWSSRGGCGNRRFTEVAGGTTAECAAIACCAPCGIANLLVLTMYKVPVGLCRKALRHQRRRRLLKRQSSEQMYYCRCGCDSAEFEIQTVGDPMLMVESMEMDEDMMELEKEMWNKFYGTGFWRSPSQRTVG